MTDSEPRHRQPSFSVTNRVTGESLSYAAGEWAGPEHLTAQVLQVLEHPVVVEAPGTGGVLVPTDFADPDLAAYVIALHIQGPDAVVTGTVPTDALTKLRVVAARDPLEEVA